MELFLLYVITRLTELKDALGDIEVLSGLLLTLVIIGRIGNELLTDGATKTRPATDGETNTDVFFYHGIRRTTSRGLKMFLPVFLVAFILNMFLPTTRDAVVIAGGYGLVEAVKNERVQRLFSKSANVASQWLDEQLNGEEKDGKKEEAKAEEKSTEAKPAADSAEEKPAEKASDK